MQFRCVQQELDVFVRSQTQYNPRSQKATTQKTTVSVQKFSSVCHSADHRIAGLGNQMHLHTRFAWFSKLCAESWDNWRKWQNGQKHSSKVPNSSEQYWKVGFKTDNKGTGLLQGPGVLQGLSWYVMCLLTPIGILNQLEFADQRSKSRSETQIVRTRIRSRCTNSETENSIPWSGRSPSVLFFSEKTQKSRMWFTAVFCRQVFEKNCFVVISFQFFGCRCSDGYVQWFRCGCVQTLQYRSFSLKIAKSCICAEGFSIKMSAKFSSFWCTWWFARLLQRRKKSASESRPFKTKASAWKLSKWKPIWKSCKVKWWVQTWRRTWKQELYECAICQDAVVRCSCLVTMFALVIIARKSHWKGTKSVRFAKSYCKRQIVYIYLDFVPWK